jgi:hypothetical protein
LIQQGIIPCPPIRPNGRRNGWGRWSYLERRRYFSEATMATIPQPEERPERTESVPSERVSATIS